MYAVPSVDIARSIDSAPAVPDRKSCHIDPRGMLVVTINVQSIRGPLPGKCCKAVDVDLYMSVDLDVVNKQDVQKKQT